MVNDPCDVVSLKSNIHREPINTEKGDKGHIGSLEVNTSMPHITLWSVILVTKFY